MIERRARGLDPHTLLGQRDPALVCGKAYLVNPGAHYFALKCDGTLVVFDDPHLEEFFSGKMHPQNRTK
jgi:hypothetical protein